MSKLTERLPKFKSEAEERAFWEAKGSDSTAYLDWSKAQRVVLPNLKPSTKTISLRLPQHLLESIKAAANARDVPYQSLIKEVKDWRLDSIGRATRTDIELITERGTVNVESPFEQVRRYLFDVVKMIESDKALTFPPEHRLRGRPLVAFGHGVVFTGITRKQFNETDLANVFPPDRCIFRDEMTESVDPEAFRDRLWAMVVRPFAPPLTLPQFDHLRALLFPEIRVAQIELPFAATSKTERDEQLLAVMDVQQEQLARSMGSGHRIVRGVAGSGKTLILAFRAEYLARAATRPVLVLCYGNGIASRIEGMMQDRGVETKVQVSTFHAWCFRMARTYDIALPGERDIPDYGMLSMHNAKGLEFPCVAVGGLGALGKSPDGPIEDDLRLTYVAVTRATHEAFVTYSRMSELVGRLVG